LEAAFQSQLRSFVAFASGDHIFYCLGPNEQKLRKQFIYAYAFKLKIKGQRGTAMLTGIDTTRVNPLLCALVFFLKVHKYSKKNKRMYSVAPKPQIGSSKLC